MVANRTGEHVRVVTGASLRVDEAADVDLRAASFVERKVVEMEDPVRPAQAAPWRCSIAGTVRRIRRRSSHSDQFLM